MSSISSLFRRYGSKSQFKTVCPFCSEQRKPSNRKAACLSVKQEVDHWVYNCWHCSATGREEKIMEAAVVAPQPWLVPVAAVASFVGEAESPRRQESSHLGHLAEFLG